MRERPTGTALTELSSSFIIGSEPATRPTVWQSVPGAGEYSLRWNRLPLASIPDWASGEMPDSSSPDFLT